jgi:hypothetical protein
MNIKTTSKALSEKLKKYFVDRKITSIASKDDKGNYTIWLCDLPITHQEATVDAMVENLGLVPRV